MWMENSLYCNVERVIDSNNIEEYKRQREKRKRREKEIV
jgi:hypothetical protein